MPAYAPCPQCQKQNSRVIETRSDDEHTHIRRRRECSGCRHRWTTFEFTDDLAQEIEAAFKRQQVTAAQLRRVFKAAAILNEG